MKLNVIENRETIDMDERGNLIRYRRIEFMLDNHGPFIYQTPAELFDLGSFKEYVKEIASQIKAMEEMEF